MNNQLKKRDMKIEGDLFDALQDGVMLIALLEVVSGKKCQEKYHAIAESEIHCRNNLTVAIKFATELIGNMNAEPAGVHDCLPFPSHPQQPPPSPFHLLPDSTYSPLAHTNDRLHRKEQEDHIGEHMAYYSHFPSGERWIRECHQIKQCHAEWALLSSLLKAATYSTM